MKVVCVHPRYLPQGFVDDVPNQQELISVLMQSRRDELAAMRETQEPVDPRLADTQHFQVHGLSQASQDEALDDVETDLQHILEGQENDVPEAAKKRRHMPGASTHFLNFRKMLQHSDEVVAATLESYRPDACLRPIPFCITHPEHSPNFVHAILLFQKMSRGLYLWQATCLKAPSETSPCWLIRLPYFG